MEDQINDKDEKKLILFLDDDGSVKDCYTNEYTIDNFLITFSTMENIITIPIFRLLKIKEKIKENRK